jgi:late competence protein required for DNA uptake (superfamily II DNA/RNA helicase)
MDTIQKESALSKITFEHIFEFLDSEDNECERCGCTMDDDLNPTPSGHYLCEDCITMEDVFPEDEEEED